MNYHQRIMNVPIDDAFTRRYPPEGVSLRAYKAGHRDARHTAAEIANEADAEVERYQQREQHFAKALGVTDGGQYRADWDSAITKVLDDLAAARAERDGLAKAAIAATALIENHDAWLARQDVLVLDIDSEWTRLIDTLRTALAALPKEDE